MSEGRQGGQFGQDFCSAPHPTRDDIWCRRFKHDDGPHRAFTVGVKVAEEWE